MPARYEQFSELDKQLNDLIVEVAELHRLAIMDGTKEAQINARVQEIRFILFDAVNYQLNLIRQDLKI